jgi:3-hydroxybutyryl-CoA dehydrogenase
MREITGTNGSTPSTSPRVAGTGGEVRRVAIIGCGLMGAGIAEVAALAGYDVIAIKATAGDVAPVRAKIEKSMARAVESKKLSPEARDAALARLTISCDLADAAGSDLIVESAVESAVAKKRLFAELEPLVAPNALIVTNTSSLNLEELATSLAHPERFLGMHFFSPVPAMKLVELAAIACTTEQAMAAASAFVVALGKTPVRLAASPGYVVNRLLVPYLLHAIESLESGLATPQDIDAAMKLGCGHPMGPLALCDLIGLDVVLAMAKTLSAELSDARYRPPTLLRRLVLEGQLGRKSKLGFYDYSAKEPVPNASIDKSSGRAAIASVA